MSTQAKTAVYVAVAVAALALGFLTRPSFEPPELFDDTGQVFFPDFTDPEQAAALEVVEFDPETREIRPFRVERKEGMWRIPSHHDYPADAKEKVAEAATLAIGLVKEGVRSDDPAEHPKFGVVDPRDERSDNEGRGVLVRFEDNAGNELAALIIGDEVEGRPGMRYVRVPGKKRVYVARISDLPSTKFEDWIETELLEASSFDFVDLVFDNSSVDETTLSVVPGDVVHCYKEDFEWKVEGIDPETEEPNEDRIREVTSELGSLKIVGVRPKPPGLTKALTLAEGATLDRNDVLALQARGFYLVQGGRIVPNEGQLFAKTDDGIAYRLLFGEVIYGEGEAITAGSEEEIERGESEGEEAEKASEKGEEEKELKANRFCMITCSFDESLLEKDKPEGEPLPKEELEKRKKAREAIEEIVAAVDKYREKHENALPESLEALTQGDEKLLDELEKDPWGNDYRLEATDDGFVVLSYGADGAEGGEGADRDVRSDDFDWEDEQQELARKVEDYEKKVEEGKKKAQRLSEKFAPWFYVIPQESFEKLHATRADLVKPKEKEEDEEEKAEQAEGEGAGDGEAPAAPGQAEASGSEAEKQPSSEGGGSAGQEGGAAPSEGSPEKEPALPGGGKPEPQEGSSEGEEGGGSSGSGGGASR